MELMWDPQMMDNVSKCGLNCAVCPWGPNARKGMTAEGFEGFRNRAKQILGYMPINTPCPTCQTPDDKIPKESKLPSRSCLIRQCVNKAGVQNCAYCARFPCDTLKGTAGLWNRESIEKRLGLPITDEEYHTFVEPFEGIARLQRIRQSLKPEEIVEPTKAAAPKAKIVAFPDNLPFSQEEVASFKSVHNLLANLAQNSMGLSGTDTFAQKHKLENLRVHVLRFLWIFGSQGALDEAGACIVVDAETYLASRGSEKSLAMWAFVEDTVFGALGELGLRCERVALKGVRSEDLATGTGYLRSRGWQMRLQFNEAARGRGALKALKSYCESVNRKFGAKAFQRFRAADMQVLSQTP